MEQRPLKLNLFGSRCPNEMIFGLSHLWGMKNILRKSGQQVKPIISKGHSSAVFWIFHQIFFLAFNSRDNTMLWVLNLFSRSSSTKLWKRIFKKCLKNFFWHSKLASGEIASYWLRGKDQIWVRNFDENFFFEKILCSLNECAHVLHHPETVENF